MTCSAITIVESAGSISGQIQSGDYKLCSESVVTLQARPSMDLRRLTDYVQMLGVSPSRASFVALRVFRRLSIVTSPAREELL